MWCAGSIGYEYAGTRGFRRGDHRPFDNRGVANDDTASLAVGQHLDGHLAVGLGASEIDQDGDTRLRPGTMNGVGNRLETGSEAAGRIAAGPGEGDVFTNHLAYHIGRALGDLR